MPFSVASYNILANAYIKPTRYPNTPPTVLATEWRIPALLRRIRDLAADVICLQEVEPDVLKAITAHFQQEGYATYYAQKKGGKPDGSATLVKGNVFEVRTVYPLYFHDGDRRKQDSGHVALVLVLEVGGRVVGVANTHLKWDAPGTPRDEGWGCRQAAELVKQQKVSDPTCSTWIVCGDLNSSPERAVIRYMRHAGLVDAYQDHAEVYTCNSNRKAKRIDYLLHTSGLTSQPVDFPIITDDTPLPSEAEPSDHLPIMASFDWTT